MFTGIKGSVLACGFLLVSLTACSRNEIGQDIVLSVVHETEVRDPFDGTVSLEQSPAENAHVYLVPYGQSGTSAAYRSASTDIDGMVTFAEVEGRYRAWVDADNDGTIDATTSAIRSGEKTIVIIGQRVDGEESTIMLSLERETYSPGETVNVKVWGSFTAPHQVAVEVWNDANDRTRKFAIELGEFQGDFSTSTVFTVKSDWPLTPSSRLADYLVVPKIEDEYHDGARFSLRRAVQSYVLDGISIQLNDGDLVTSLRNVTANLTGNNVSTVALAENPADFGAGIPPRLPFGPQVDFQLSAGDGVKTVWAMFYDIDGNFAGPVSDSIYLDSQPVVPITGMSVEINYGAAATSIHNAVLSFTATNASTMAISESQASFPYGVIRQPFASSAPYQLSAGDGLKTVWVMYYDAFGRYYGPVSDSILIDTTFTAPPVTGASILINGGAAATNNQNVTLTLGATNAVSMALTETPGLFPDGVLRFPYSTSFGFQLSAGDGPKTVWAMFFDSGGNYAAPVSATIQFDQSIPKRPDPALMFVTPYAPGMHDLLTGLDGAVNPGNLVTVYSDMFLTNILTQGYATNTGSFILDIGDGSIPGNVFKPQDWVFVTAGNAYGSESTAAVMENDSTPPDLRVEDIFGLWETDNLGANVGNVGDVFLATYAVPSGYLPATDVTGGEVDFSWLGGPSSVPLTEVLGSFYFAKFTMPASVEIDFHALSFRMRLVDEAFNYSNWVSTDPLYAVDTVPPEPAIMLEAIGGNRQMITRWQDTNYDSVEYMLHFTTATGESKAEAVQAPYVGYYFTPDLHNCFVWNVKMEVKDDGGNVSLYSNSLTAYVTLPPPLYETWSGIAKNTAMIAFGVAAVDNATGYEANLSTATGAPYHYETPLYSSPFTVSPPELTGVVMRFPGLPTNTVFYTATRAVDNGGPSACYSEYSAETTARTELYVASVTDGVERSTVGGALAAVRDIDSDGATDILAGAPYPQSVSLVSGNLGEVVGSFGIYHAPDSYDIPGTPLAAGNLDDLTDPEHEYIIGSPLEPAGGKLLAGRVRVYDHNQTLLATLDGTEAGQQFGYSVATVGAIGSTGTNFVVGGFGCAHKDCGYAPFIAAATEGPGRVVLYKGSDRTEIKEFTGYTKGDYFGVALTGGLDLTGDSIPDFAIGSPGSGYVLPPTQVTVISGANLKREHLINLYPPDAIRQVRPGAALAMLDDINGNGIAELAVGVPMFNDEQGSVVVLELKNGAFQPVWVQYGTMANAGPNFGAVLAAGGDVNGDGVPDLIVGAPLGQQNFFYGAGSAYVLDGATGKFLYEFQGWGEGLGRDGSVGYSVLLPGDIRGGPRAEWVVGAPGSAYGGYQSGRIYILSTDW